MRENFLFTSDWKFYAFHIITTSFQLIVINWFTNYSVPIAIIFLYATLSGARLSRRLVSKYTFSNMSLSFATFQIFQIVSASEILKKLVCCLEIKGPFNRKAELKFRRPYIKRALCFMYEYPSSRRMCEKEPDMFHSQLYTKMGKRYLTSWSLNTHRLESHPGIYTSPPNRPNGQHSHTFTDRHAHIYIIAIHRHTVTQLFRLARHPVASS